MYAKKVVQLCEVTGSCVSSSLFRIASGISALCRHCDGQYSQEEPCQYSTSLESVLLFCSMFDYYCLHSAFVVVDKQ